MSQKDPFAQWRRPKKTAPPPPPPKEQENEEPEPQKQKKQEKKTRTKKKKSPFKSTGGQRSFCFDMFELAIILLLSMAMGMFCMIAYVHYMTDIVL